MNPIYSKSTSYFNVSKSLQKSLEATHYLSRVGHVAHAAIKSVGNVFSPLVSSERRSLKGRVTDIAVNLIKGVGSILLIAVAILAGLRGIAWFISGTHDLHLNKYQTALNQYGSNLNGHVETFKRNTHLHVEPQVGRLLKQCIDLLTPRLSMDARERYQEFVKKLDEVALAIEGISDPTADQVACILAAEELALDRWSGVDMKAHFEQRIELATGKKGQGPNSLSDLPSAIKSTNEMIKQAPPSTKKSWIALEWQKARGGPLGNKNYTGTENVPNRLAVIHHGGGKEDIIQMRHGSPTTGVKKGEDDTIAPNYELFIRAANRKGKSVFYTIHQKLQKGGFEDESPRTRAILALQNKYPNFHAMVQPLDGEFYNKTGKYDKSSKFSELKNALGFEFFENQDNPSCKLPNLPTAAAQESSPRFEIPLTRERYRDRFNQIIDEVRRVYFPEKGENDSFSKEEWQDFIHIFYAYQRIDLRESIPNVGYVVTACKDDLDRGGGQQLLEHTLLLIMEDSTGSAESMGVAPPALRQEELTAPSSSSRGLTNPTEKTKLLQDNILGAPLNVKQKEVIGSRLDPILGTLKRRVFNNEGTIKVFGRRFFGVNAPTSVEY